MTVTTLTDAKPRFSELVASAEATHERTTITKNGRRAVVISSAEDVDSLEETLAIMSDPELLSAVRDRADQVPRRSVNLVQWRACRSQSWSIGSAA